MNQSIAKWKTQIRKGYLELSILTLIEQRHRAYGFEIITELAQCAIELKEGTLYPLLSRMVSEGTLESHWETETNKGHPRKFYELTERGALMLGRMQSEFKEMVRVFNEIKNQRGSKSGENRQRQVRSLSGKTRNSPGADQHQ